MNRDQFESKYGELGRRFDALKPELELTVRDPALGVEGFVVVWSTLAAASGPLGRIGKGGTRITPTVTLDEVGMLARVMTLKNAAAGIPLGGAKSGLRADPRSPGFEKQYRRFVRLVSPILAENGGPFGGFGFDLGGDPQHVRWACEELGSTRSFTGKPLEMGGTDYDREGIAGLGVAEAARAMCEFRGISVSGKRAAVQGLGAMGAAVCRYFADHGGIISVVSDPRIGGTVKIEPFASQALAALQSGGCAALRAELAQRGIAAEPIDRVLYEEVDVLFPCAVQDVITTANVGQIRAKCVVEGANRPCTPEARLALWQRGIDLVPDFIANPGGILAAYVELSLDIPPEENVRTRRKVNEAKRLTIDRINANVREMLTLSSQHKVEPAVAGRYLALRSIFADEGR